MKTTAASKTMRVARQSITYAVGVTSYMVMITIGQSTTTSLSHTIIGITRAAAAGALIFCLFRLSRLRSIGRQQLATVAMLAGLVAWAALASMRNQSIYVVSQVMLIDVFVIAAGLLIFSRASGKVLPDGFSRFFAVYVALAFSVTLATGGLILDFPPRFSLEYAEGLYAGQLEYVHGASNFYGLGSIAATFWLVRAKGAPEQLLSASMVALFLVLSVIGGARGDTVIAFLIIIVYVVVRAPGKSALWIAALVLASFMLVTDWMWVEDILFVQRLLSIGEGDFGYRDQLHAQVMVLLSREPGCLLAGCGVGYFQHYYGYDQSMYPHNVILESLVIFGLPLTAMFVLLTVYGGVRYYRRVGECDMFLLFVLFALGVSMKSGSLFGSWLTLTGCLFLMSHCFVGRRRSSLEPAGGRLARGMPGNP